MQAFPREVTDFVGEQFCAFFVRRRSRALTLPDARRLIDYVAGPTPGSGAGSGRAVDLTRPFVRGGGRTRPSPGDIDALLRKYTGAVPDSEEWDAVFEELIRCYQSERNSKALRVIRLAFERCRKRDDICRLMHISTQTFHNYRLAVLCRASVLAAARGLLKLCG